MLYSECAVQHNYDVATQKKSVHTMITIKKYKNRRLYDTSTSRYVNLEDVADMVRNEEEFEVRDVTSGEDITRIILTQIIMEGARDNEHEMPIEFLRQMISTSGRTRQELMARYTTFVSGLYQRAQTEIKDRFQNSNPEGTSKSLNPIDALQRFVPAGTLESMWPKSNRNADHPDSAPADTAAELVALRQKLEELEAAMSAPTAQSDTEEIGASEKGIQS